MVKTELKQLLVDKVLANFYQPRTKFDKEQIKELAESILSNGLINPITVRKWKGGRWMIVAGERRWRAHRLAGMKTIQAFVKEYKDDGEWMIESLIENVHREDLAPLEKAKYLKKILDIEKIPSIEQLSKKVRISTTTIKDLFQMYNMRDTVRKLNLSQTQISETKSLGPNDRKKVLEKASKNEIGNRRLREIVKVVKQSPEGVKEALLSDKINVEQAERISKLKTEKERDIAIKQHKQIAEVQDSVERVVEQQMSAVEKRRLDKQLMQSGNWITSFKGKVNDSKKELEKTLKVLMVSTKFIPVMDENQKSKLEKTLDRFIEILNRGKQLAEQIQGRL